MTWTQIEVKLIKVKISFIDNFTSDKELWLHSPLVFQFLEGDFLGTDF